MRNFFCLQKALMMLLCIPGFFVPSMAQVMVSGKVTDGSTRQPLAGVNVLVKGTLTGTITDMDGNYSINLEPGSQALVFSFIG